MLQQFLERAKNDTKNEQKIQKLKLKRLDKVINRKKLKHNEDQKHPFVPETTTNLNETIKYPLEPTIKTYGTNNHPRINRRTIHNRLTVSAVTESVENKVNKGHLHRHVPIILRRSTALVYLRSFRKRFTHHHCKLACLYSSAYHFSLQNEIQITRTQEGECFLP